MHPTGSRQSSLTQASQTRTRLSLRSPIYFTSAAVYHASALSSYFAHLRYSDRKTRSDSCTVGWLLFPQISAGWFGNLGLPPLSFNQRRSHGLRWRASTAGRSWSFFRAEREGFGLPLIEALACGTPVLASGAPVFREIGGQAVTYCRSNEPIVWKEAIQALLDKPVTNEAPPLLIRLRQAASFSWTQHAAIIVRNLFVALQWAMLSRFHPQGEFSLSIRLRSSEAQNVFCSTFWAPCAARPRRRPLFAPLRCRAPSGRRRSVLVCMSKL